MPTIPCPTFVPCCGETGPCLIDPPLMDYQADAVDHDFAVGMSGGQGVPGLFPPLSGDPSGGTFNCVQICEVVGGTQEDAENCATFEQQRCVIANDPSPNPDNSIPGDVGGAKRPPQNAFVNSAQSCTLDCGGSSNSFTTPPGTFVSTSQILADRMAFFYACKKASENLVCLGDIQLGPTVSKNSFGLFNVSVNDLDGHCCTGASVDFVISAGGKGPFNFDVSGLPDGLSFEVFNGRTMRITGSTTSPGNTAFSVRVTNGIGQTAIQNYFIKSVQIENDSTLPTAIPGTPYSSQLTVAGGDAPYSFNLVGGTLPPGLSIDLDTGIISGTPTCKTGEGSSFTVACTDANGPGCIKTFSIACGTCDPSTTPALDSHLSVTYGKTVYASTPDKIFASSVDTTQVTVLNASDGTIFGSLTLPGTALVTMLFYESKNNRVYVGHSLGGIECWLTAYNASTLAQVSSIHMVSPPTSEFPPSFASFDESRNRLWVSDGQNIVFVVNCTSFAYTAIDLSQSPSVGSIGPTDGLCYCTDIDAFAVAGQYNPGGHQGFLTIDAATLTYLNAYDVYSTQQCERIAFCPDNDIVYLNMFPDGVLKVNPADGSSALISFANSNPADIVYNPCLHRIMAFKGLGGDAVRARYINPSTDAVIDVDAGVSMSPSVYPSQGSFDTLRSRMLLSTGGFLLRFT